MAILDASGAPIGGFDDGVPLVDPLDLYGIRRSVELDESEGRFVFHAEQDIEAIVDNNKALANAGRGFTPSGDMKHLADIPLIIVEKWKNELGVDIFNKDHAKKVKQLLDDPDWRYLRTSTGYAT